MHTHTHAATLQEKKTFECVRPPTSLSPVHSPCLCLIEKKDASHSAPTLNHYPPVFPSVHLIFQSDLSVGLSAGVTLCSPFFLAENISMWRRAHLSEPDGCLSNCHSALPHPLKVKHKKSTEGISVAQNTRHSHAPWRRHAVVPVIQTPFIFLSTLRASSHRRGHPPTHQRIYSTTATPCPFFRGKWALNAALDLEADLRL